MVLSVRPDVSGRADKIILPGLPAVGDGLLHSCSKRSYTAFRFRLKGTAKKKIIRKAVKAPLWHKHKRNGLCVISLKRLCSSQAWRKALFSAYAVGGTRSFKILLGDGVPTDKTAFTEKLVWGRKKSGDSFQNLPFYCYFCIRRVLWRLRNAQKNNAVDN